MHRFTTTDRCRDLFTATATGQPERIGLEVELIPVDADTRRRCPIHESTGPQHAPPTLPVLRQMADTRGWTERPSPYGAPVFVAPDGAVISYEPGGQIEYSAAPSISVPGVLASVRSTLEELRLAARRAGIELVTAGIDPYNDLDGVPLQLLGPRYAAMDRYFAVRGEAGAQMMRQTAACQLTVDAGSAPIARWRLLNAIAPYATALFANSARYAGADSGFVSARAAAWRRLDPARTGVPGATDEDPATAYEAFALEAPAILWGHRTHPPFGALLESGRVTEADWPVHLTTLFPEVRPRRIGDVRTFELRSIDALPVEWCTVACVFVISLLNDRDAQAEAIGLAGAPDAAKLEQAARCGVRDPSMRMVAADLFSLALESSRRLGERLVDGSVLEWAEEFRRRYVSRGRSPGDDAPLGTSVSPDADLGVVRTSGAPATI